MFLYYSNLHLKLNFILYFRIRTSTSPRINSTRASLTAFPESTRNKVISFVKSFLDRQMHRWIHIVNKQIPIVSSADRFHWQVIQAIFFRTHYLLRISIKFYINSSLVLIIGIPFEYCINNISKYLGT